jgi:hypothetical protein
MPVAVSRRFCKVCEERTRHTREVATVGCVDFLLIVVTCGVWLLIKIPLSGLLFRWHCDECGA